VDACTFSNIPAGATASVTGESPIVVNDGTLVFTTDFPGTYKVEILAFPDLPYEVTLDAT